MKTGSEQKRVDGRTEFQLRPIRIATGASPYAEGSAEVQLGSTKMLITASIDSLDPAKEEAGQIFASLNMLPRSMHLRIRDEEMGDVIRQELRSLQQLIVRSLSAAVPAEALNKISITVDCSIVCSDAGIATAAIAGGWVALYQSLRWATMQKLVSADLSITRVAAISCGIIKGQSYIDLCAEEAAAADFTANLVFDEHSKLIDVRGTREREALDLESYISLLNLAAKQISPILLEQERAVLEMG